MGRGEERRGKAAKEGKRQPNPIIFLFSRRRNFPLDSAVSLLSTHPPATQTATATMNDETGKQSHAG